MNMPEHLPLPDLTSLTPKEMLIFVLLAAVCLATFFMSDKVDREEKERRKKQKEQQKAAGQKEGSTQEEIDELNGNIMM